MIVALLCSSYISIVVFIIHEEHYAPQAIMKCVAHVCHSIMINFGDFLAITWAESQVSYSDHCCLSSLNLSHFHFLLQIHWADFNQTCHKAFFDEGDSSLSNLRPCLFLRVDKNKIVKNIGKFKDLLSHRNNFKQIWHKASLNERNQCVFRWKATPFSKGRW